MRADKPLQVVALCGSREPQKGATRPVSRGTGSDRIEERAPWRDGRRRARKWQAAGSSMLHGIFERGIDLVIEMHDEQPIACNTHTAA